MMRVYLRIDHCQMSTSLYCYYTKYVYLIMQATMLTTYDRACLYSRRGSLRTAGPGGGDDAAAAAVGAKDAPSKDAPSQVILFTGDPSLVRREAPHVYHCAAHEQEVVFINERQVMSHGGMGHLNQQGGAQPDLLKRPGTAVGSRN